MSGVDNINGISYQVSFSLLKTIELLAEDNPAVDKIKFESINEEEEDYTVYNLDNTIDYYQIKKRTEEYQWSKSAIRDVIYGFVDKYTDETNFFFVTNGSGNQDIKRLKGISQKKRNDISNEDETFLHYFVSERYTLEQIIDTLLKTTFFTRYFVSITNEEDGMIKNEIIRNLNSSRFFCRISVEQLYNSLWMYVFDKSKISECTSYNTISSDFFELGLEILEESRNKTENIVGRLDEINEVLRITEPIIIIKGISGIGKSSIAKKINCSHPTNSILIEISSLMTIDDLKNIFLKQLKYLNLENSVEKMSKSEPSEYISDLIKVIQYEGLWLTIDGYDKANHQLKDFIDQIGENLLLEHSMFGAKLFLVSVERPDFYNDVHIKLHKVHEYLVNGLSYEDTLELFVNTGSSNEVVAKLHEKVAGYPLALLYIKQLIQFDSYDIEEIEQISVENATEILFKKIYGYLNEEQKKVAETATIFLTTFDMKDVEAAYDNELSSKFVLKDLFKLSILDIRDNKYIIHDVIRQLIGKSLPEKRIATLHLNYARYLYQKVEETSLFSDIFRWGYHYENSLDMTKNCVWLSNLEIEKINALGAIYEYGYPLNFWELSEDELENMVLIFEEKEWIKKSVNKLGIKNYVVNNMDTISINY